MTILLIIAATPLRQSSKDCSGACKTGTCLPARTARVVCAGTCLATRAARLVCAETCLAQGLACPRAQLARPAWIPANTGSKPKPPLHHSDGAAPHVACIFCENFAQAWRRSSRAPSAEIQCCRKGAQDLFSRGGSWSPRPRAGKGLARGAAWWHLTRWGLGRRAARRDQLRAETPARGL